MCEILLFQNEMIRTSHVYRNNNTDHSDILAPLLIHHPPDNKNRKFPIGYQHFPAT